MPLSEFPQPAEEASGIDLPDIRITPPGPASRSAFDRLERVECPAFGHRREAREEASGVNMTPVFFTSGKGANLFDVDGNRYVDLAAGFGSVLLGHGAPSVARALEAQADRMLQALGDLYSADIKVALLERLASIHPGQSPRVLLCQSGSDAVSAALKTCVLATGKPGVVAFEGSYHGLGYGPLAACGLRESYRAPFAAQLNPHVTFAPYPKAETDLDASLSAVEKSLARGDVGAVLVEPILGRGGVVVPPNAFLTGLSELAHRHGALVIADEIWTGLGRTGAMLRSSAAGASADVVVVGKGLGGGLSISACIAPDAVMQAWARGGQVVHTSTHAGAPLPCAVAIAVLDSLRFRRLVPNAAEVGARTKAYLQGVLAGAPGVVDVRGQGLMLGVAFENGALALRVMHRMLELGYIVTTGGPQGEVIVWTPALTIAEEQLTAAADAMKVALA
ncbi:MAG: aspartate aminotransferase family protein [Polyangiaceae bacterium]|nr:aspartate aminotransferase family protein [Polyangiaceae bacterium]